MIIVTFCCVSQMRRQRLSCGGWYASICRRSSRNCDCLLMNRSKLVRRLLQRDCSLPTAKTVSHTRAKPRRSSFSRSIIIISEWLGLGHIYRHIFLGGRGRWSGVPNPFWKTRSTAKPIKIILIVFNFSSHCCQIFWFFTSFFV